MNRKKQKRAIVLGKVDRIEISAHQAGEVMGLSLRQVGRLLAKYRKDGPAALAHGNRGCRPVHAIDTAVRSRVLELAQAKYAGFNHLHLTEKLQEAEGINISRSSVRRIPVRSGIKSPRKRRAPKHHRRRERIPQEGMMLQIGGSRHDWLIGWWLTITLLD